MNTYEHVLLSLSYLCPIDKSGWGQVEHPRRPEEPLQMEHQVFLASQHLGDAKTRYEYCNPRWKRH